MQKWERNSFISIISTIISFIIFFILMINFNGCNQDKPVDGPTFNVIVTKNPSGPFYIDYSITFSNVPTDYTDEHLMFVFAPRMDLIKE